MNAIDKFTAITLGALAGYATIGFVKNYVIGRGTAGVGVVYHNSALAKDNDGNGTDEMFPVKLKDLKDGFFKLRPTDSAPVWIKREYDRSERKYYCEKYDGHGEKYLKGDTVVYAGFYF